MKKKFKLSEDTVSMFLGLVIVATIIGLIFDFVSKKFSGSVPKSKNDSVLEDDKNVDEQDVYVIKENDSLWKIAEKEYASGYKWTEIAKENKLENPGMLFKGQKLILPKIGKKTDIVIKHNENKSIEKGEYKVVRGDSLWKISVKAYGDGYQWTKIWQTNKKALRDPNKLEIGMVLMIE